jgi:hypothetical protein
MPEVSVLNKELHININANKFAEDRATNGSHNKLLREPLKLNSVLKNFKSFNVTPIIGIEYLKSKLANWIKALNSNALLKDLAINSKL